MTTSPVLSLYPIHRRQISTAAFPSTTRLRPVPYSLTSNFHLLPSRPAPVSGLCLIHLHQISVSTFPSSARLRSVPYPPPQILNPLLCSVYHPITRHGTPKNFRSIRIPLFFAERSPFPVSELLFCALTHYPSRNPPWNLCSVRVPLFFAERSPFPVLEPLFSALTHYPSRNSLGIFVLYASLYSSRNALHFPVSDPLFCALTHTFAR